MFWSIKESKPDSGEQNSVGSGTWMVYILAAVEDMLEDAHEKRR